MTWTVQADGPGRWVLQVDGQEVGMISMLDTVPATGRALFPSVRAGHVAAAMNDFDTTVNVDPYRLAGWSSIDEYHAEVQAIKELRATLPATARAQIESAWHRHAAAGWTTPLTRPQMTAWQDEVLHIATTHNPPASNTAA